MTPGTAAGYVRRVLEGKDTVAALARARFNPGKLGALKLLAERTDALGDEARARLGARVKAPKRRAR